MALATLKKGILMETKGIIENLIHQFNNKNLISLLRTKTRTFRLIEEKLIQLNDEQFSESSLFGEFKVNNDLMVVVTARVNKPLSERSGKKAQYTLGKKFLKDSQRYIAGFFIFYDDKGDFRFSLIYDIPLSTGKRDWSNFRRYTYFVSKDQTNKTFIKQFTEADFSSLEKIIDAFSVEKVTKQFYQEIANWYFWAMDKVEFPDDEEKDREKRNAKNLIRLITRIIFIWFMKEKELIPSTLFDKSFIDKIINYKDKTSSTYYKAILQNLFFATLNTKMKRDDSESRIFVEEAEKKGYLSDAYLQQGYYRYSRFIKDKDLFIEQFENVPFLNGGLFECLDKKIDGKEIRIDCFSDNPKNETKLKVPDEIFFLEKEIDVDLSKYLDKGKNKKVTGLLTILKRYNFTIDENTPVDQDVALDPELLGKVFENLLAAYVPETSETARKATGSYYTPREIVEYMVNESLIEHLKTSINNSDKNFEKNLRSLFDYASDENPFDEQTTLKLIEAIENIKILDPACGSGAFPMGILHKLVLALHKLDPDNKIWKKKLLERVPPEIREELEQSLENKSVDYIRKLGLIEKCIYGIDIQEIAIQISKLRFFISLLVEQEIDDSKPNRDIRALPNLETKFVAANTLIGLEIPTIDLFSENHPIRILQDQLKSIRNKYFNAKTRTEKLRLQEEDKELRKKISAHISDTLIIKKQEEINKLEKQLTDAKTKLGQIENEPEQKDVYKRTTLFGQNETIVVDRKEEKIKVQKSLIASIEKKINSLKAGDNKDAIRKVAEQISSFNPYDQNTHSDWFDPEWMFGIKVSESSGFDIVIGNPPYIQLQKAINKTSKLKYADLYKDQNYKTFERTGDIYCLFYEKGINLLRENGHLCFITSNKWMRAAYGESLREFFAKFNPKILVDLGPSVFESATVDTNILLIQKCRMGDDSATIRIGDDSNTIGIGDDSATLRAVTISKDDNVDIQKQLNEKGVVLNKLTKDAWFIGSNAEQKLKEKIERIGKPLKDWDVNIYYGIKTGLNEAFIITTEKRNEILENCSVTESSRLEGKTERERTEEIIKPILRGRDIKRYYYEWAGLWVIVIPAGWTKKVTQASLLEEKAEKEIKKIFPSLMNHLLPFKTKAQKRDDQGDYWWELRHCAYYSAFENEKVVWSDIATRPIFTILERDIYFNNTVYMIVSKHNINYFTAVLNSKLVEWLFPNIASDLGEKGNRYFKIFVEKIPLPPITPINEPIVKQIEMLVDKILAAKKSNESVPAFGERQLSKVAQATIDTSKWEKEIDLLVYKLYDLTNEEIKIIEGK